ncbi:MAG: SPOR domain-containing protein [Burkholderiales bacterium]|jgi:cell division protein FtsN|nr:SPOR domain-containing protein [Burkholderiales bacterium]
MSRDYKKTETRGRTGTMMLGIFVGLVLGLVAALAIAFYLNRAANPFAARDKPAPVQAPGKAATAEPAGTASPSTRAPAAAEPGKAAPEAKPRFDFYTILPGIEQPATDQDLRNRTVDTKAAVQERYFLQAGAFQNAQDADNLKARLALMGLEASIQTANLGEKGIWHRVRLGPFDDADALGRVRSQLAGSGIEAAPIKVREKRP